MRLEPVSGEWKFVVRCLRCGCECTNDPQDVSQRPLMIADLDGAPFLSYYCEHCASFLTPELAKELADKARKDRRSIHTA